ncbi:MAG: sugar-binding transcriptional regulator [Mesorhizobium sp.]|uniref:DNA-binding transcriptional regulator n=1 Tax=Mesorhizobium mediterraneum TaxID=43617 RepID=A0AB36RDZ8_9HYPH|nr:MULTISPECIES: sugar-binding transcriptional regulator [Mesorhizobium]RUU24423.1 sugar-binding transcriptional regulator [Mesorhizobium sp. M6A.T.Ca.TU.002.02.2.1]AZO64150.1 sugar-binding transcriptional regulator [Mesorhizobium sp. M6A.T.Cr.TU.016.01.1.1]PAQ03161.1 DNA-binding transcriptional regulator [Mesorhizobium mediterraneum]RVB73445.1 sugar-binding transcriptional regulator [Mesorhizobium sp. M6A.T.Cr.TU.014.01.1.1]RWM24000.1 MAG: sugar-binding transcriptional regulator [Mesorhizobiu
MVGFGNGLLRDDETSMATRAAWLHYAGGLTQSEVAKRLGLTSLKAHRLITKANQEGLVKVYIDGEVSECVALEDELSSRYGLDYCEVVPDFDGEDLPLKALGIAGAQFLKREIERGEDTLIGVGHGRTLAACVEYLPRISAEKTRFVSLLGGLTRKFSANPHDVIHRLAERTGAEAYVMPVPMFANTVEDRTVLLGQKGISEVFDLGKAADLLIAGIGTAEREASLVATGMIEKGEMEEIRRKGGVGELLGHFFDDAGKAVETTLSNRALALAREDISNRRIVAVAGGKVKVRAIKSVLEGRYLKGLVTDERTARSLVEQTPVG